MSKSATRSSGWRSRTQKRREGRASKVVGSTEHALTVRATKGALTVPGVKKGAALDPIAKALGSVSAIRPRRGAQAQLAELSRGASAPKSVAGLSGQDALAVLIEGAREAERRHTAAGRAVPTYDECGRRTGEVTRVRQAEPEA